MNHPFYYHIIDNFFDIDKAKQIEQEFPEYNCPAWFKYNNQLEIKAFLSDNEYIHMKKVNETLWKIEDKIRQKEKDQEFDDEFIKLARSVYINNDKRAEIKRKIMSRQIHITKK